VAREVVPEGATWLFVVIEEWHNPKHSPGNKGERLSKKRGDLESLAGLHKAKRRHYVALGLRRS
jgi:hypothetical protein